VIYHNEYSGDELGHRDRRASLLHELFERQAAKTPDAMAVVYGNESLTYFQVEAEAEKLAYSLRSLGVSPDSVVGVLMERSLEMVIALLGVLKAGGAYLPLEPSLPQVRLEYMIDDAKPSVVLTQTSLVARLSERDVCLVRVELGHDPPSEYAQEGASPLLGFPQTLAYVIYTSGSTGKPKGVAVPHAGIINRVLWMQAAFHLGMSDRVLQKTPFGFDVSVWELFWTLASGATVVMAKPGGHQNPQYLVSLIEREAVTLIHFVPPMLEVFLRVVDPSLCRSLKRVICSGQTLSVDLQRRFYRSFPDVELHNLYGPTEASVDVTHWRCEKGSELLSVPIGYAISNIDMYILNEQLLPVAKGGIGELYIAGLGLARGYLGRPGLTANCFVANPFGPPGSRMYRTGDQACHLENGAIHFLGRLDEQVKILGHRIELGEIEAAIASLAGVAEAVVTAISRGTDTPRLAAYIVPESVDRSQSDALLSASSLRSALLARLPGYMVPAYFLFLDHIPVTNNGKVDRAALPPPSDILSRETAKP